MKELTIILIVLIVLIIFLSFILTLYYANKNNSKVSQFSGGIISNNGSSCGICAIINLYEGLIRPDYEHPQSVNEYDMDLGLPRNRLLDNGELLSGHIIKLFTDNNFNCETNVFFLEKTKFNVNNINNIQIFNELITSPICGMIIYVPGHYFTLIIINYQIFIKLNGYYNSIHSKNDMLYDNIGIMDEIHDLSNTRSAVLTVNKKMEIKYDDASLFNSFDVIKNIIDTYLSTTSNIKTMYIAINNFIDIILNNNLNIDKNILHSFILHVRNLHYHLCVSGQNFSDIINKENTSIDEINNINNSFDKLLIFAYSTNHNQAQIHK